MLLRLALPIITVLCTALPAAAETLPRTMLGTWAADAAACERDESDSRVKVEARWIEFFASGYTIRTWSRRSEVLTGRGRKAEEGEAGSSRGFVTLQLLPDAKLRISRDGYDSDVYVKCPRNRGVR